MGFRYFGAIFIKYFSPKCFLMCLIFTLFVIMIYVLSKSEWKMSANLVFTSFVCLLLSWIFSLFIVMPEKFLYILAVLLAGSVIWSVIENQS